MDILVSQDNNVFIEKGIIDRGYFPADYDRELYRITNGENVSYAVTDGFIVYKDVEIPETVEPMKYCYNEADGFYLNPDWVEPPKPIEEQLAELSETLELLNETLLEIMMEG